MSEAGLLSSIKAKRVPSLRGRSGAADLQLQELEILSALRTCDSLSKVDNLIDKCLVYIGLSKNLEV